MAVQSRFQFGAGIVTNSGAPDMGFDSAYPPGYNAGSESVLSHGASWVAIGAAVWLAVLYVHFHTY